MAAGVAGFALAGVEVGVSNVGGVAVLVFVAEHGLVVVEDASVAGGFETVGGGRNAIWS